MRPTRLRAPALGIGVGAIALACPAAAQAHGIVGRARVAQTDHGLVRSAKGTRVGSLTAGGRTVRFPRTGVLEIPGVAKLQRHVVTRSHTGLKVVALRITVLDGSGAVIDLGEAQLRIHRLSR